MIWATKAGTKGMVWVGLALGLFINTHPHARQAALLSMSALLIAEGVVNVVMKPLIRRRRPFEQTGLAKLLVSAPGPHSWPSAHAASSAAAATVLAVMYPIWAPAFILLAVLIAYSRVYVGVHYPLDVLSGAIVGTLAGAVVLACVALAAPAVGLG